MSCLLIALVALGINSYRKFSLEDMPAVDVPYVTVSTVWVGASAEDIEKDITKHIEDAVSGIDGLKHIHSDNLENLSQILLEFKVGVNVDIAAQDVREKTDTVLSDLPDGAERPVIQKYDIHASPVVNLFLSGEVSTDDLYDYADNELADKFATVSGVAEVKVYGGNEKEVWVELDRGKLAASGLTAYDVAGALRGSVLSLPGGRLRDSGSEYSLRFDAEYETVPEIENLEVANKNGSRVLLRDVGSVRMATEEVRERAILDGKQGVVIKIVKKSEGNTVKVVNDCRKRFEDILPEMPGGMNLAWVSDESQNIEASVDSAVESVWQAVLLCAFILFAFLVNIRTTVIVAITMPVTICISLFFMQIAGQSLNVVTLLAIGLSTGVLVSNSIVVLENVVSKFEEIDDKWEAASVGASEVTVAVLASAGTNVIVMLPMTMMTSLVGSMLVPFALTTLIVNGASIFICFTLTPILCALFLKSGAERKDNAFSRFGKRWDAGFRRAASGYTSFLRKLLGRKIYAVAITAGFIALFMASVKFAGGSLGFTMMDVDDLGRVFIRVELPPYYSLEKTIIRLDEIQSRLLKFSDIDHVLTTAGRSEAMSGQASAGVYMGQIEMFFKSKLERDWTIAERLEEIRTLLSDETDCLVSASVPSKTGGQNLQIDYTFSGTDLDVLEASANAIRDASRKLPGVSQIDTTVRDTKPEIRVVPKRPVLSDMRIQPSVLGSMVRANVEGIEAASYKRGDRTYDIRVKFSEIPGKEQVKQFLLPGAAGKAIPLETVADVVDDHAKLNIFRTDKRRSVKIIGDISKGATMSGIAAEILKTARDGGMIPPGYTLETGGMNEIMNESIADFAETILIAAFLTVLLLCAILESWSRPGLVLLTLPMGLIGVLWSLYFSRFPITVFVLLGILMLIGIVVNAAILIVDKMGLLIRGGMGRHEAMFAAIEDQFRPVVMVVLASGLGMLPIAVSTGIGSENRSGIGIASVGGIIVAGVLTLVVLPAVSALFKDKKK